MVMRVGHGFAVIVIGCAATFASAQSAEKALEAFRSGEWKTVIEAAKAVPEGAKDRARAMYVAGEAQLVIGDAKGAVESFRAVIAAKSGAEPAKIGLARALVTLGELEEAESLLSAAEKTAPKDAFVKLALGELRLKQKRVEDARKVLGEAWVLDSKSGQVARGLCEAHWAADADAEAAKVVATVMKSRPKDPLGWFLRGVELDRAGKDGDAIEAYEKAIALDGKFLDAHKNLAIVCHTRNVLYTDERRTKKAMEGYRRYFELGGVDEELKKGWEMLVGFLEGGK